MPVYDIHALRTDSHIGCRVKDNTPLDCISGARIGTDIANDVLKRNSAVKPSVLMVLEEGALQFRVALCGE